MRCRPASARPRHSRQPGEQPTRYSRPAVLRTRHGPVRSPVMVRLHSKLDFERPPRCLTLGQALSRQNRPRYCAQGQLRPLQPFHPGSETRSTDERGLWVRTLADQALGPKSACDRQLCPHCRRDAALPRTAAACHCGLMHRSNQHPIRSPRRCARAALPALRGAECLRRADPSATSITAPDERRHCCRRARRERANPLRLRRHLENGSISMSRLYQRTISARAVPAYSKSMMIRASRLVDQIHELSCVDLPDIVK